MGCPLYQDYTRTCIKEFPQLVKTASFEICESNQYVGCQIYKICTSNYKCEFLKTCANQYIEKLPKIISLIFMDEKGVKEMTDVLMEFCLSSEKSKLCAKYLFYSKGETPPINLLPDGRKISPFDLLLKRKVIVKSKE